MFFLRQEVAKCVSGDLEKSIWKFDLRSGSHGLPNWAMMYITRSMGHSANICCMARGIRSIYFNSQQFLPTRFAFKTLRPPVNTNKHTPTSLIRDSLGGVGSDPLVFSRIMFVALQVSTRHTTHLFVHQFYVLAQNVGRYCRKLFEFYRFSDLISCSFRQKLRNVWKTPKIEIWSRMQIKSPIRRVHGL